MTMSAEPQTIPATLANAPAPEPGPTAGPDAFTASLDAEMERASAAAWAEAPVEAQQAHERAQQTSPFSLAATPNDELMARLTEVEEMASIAAEAEAAVEREIAAGVAPDDDAGDEGDDLGDVVDAVAAHEASPASAELEQTRAELAALREHDQHVLSTLAELSGYALDPNDPQRRPRVQVLSDRNARGQLDATEREELQTFLAVQQLAGPAFRAGAGQTVSKFNASWSEAVGKFVDHATGAGVGRTDAEAVAAAPSPLVRAFELGQAAGRRASRSTAPSKPKTAVPSMRPAAAASSRVRMSTPEPLEVNTMAAPAPGFLAKAFNNDGTLKPEFEAKMRRGELLDVDLSKL